MPRTAMAAVVTAPIGAINMEDFPVPSVPSGQLQFRTGLIG